MSHVFTKCTCMRSEESTQAASGPIRVVLILCKRRTQETSVNSACLFGMPNSTRTFAKDENPVRRFARTHTHTHTCMILHLKHQPTTHSKNISIPGSLAGS